MDERRARVQARFRKAVAGLGAVEEIPRRAGGGDPPLSFAQERLWFMERFAPGTSAYVLPVSARLRGPVDPERLQRSLDAVVARHESLRMTFPAGPDGRPEVRVADRVHVPLRVVDAPTEAAARRVLSADAALPFDPASGPLLRATLVRLAADDHALLIAVHHIVADGWSAELVLRELLTPPEREPRLGFGDYAAWQRERLSGARLAADLAFWRGELDGVRVLDLPLDRPRPPRQGFQGGWHDLDLDVAAFRELCKAEGATLYMGLLAAFQVLLARWSGVTDFAVGSPVAGRSRPEFEDMVGLFVNLLPMRARLAGYPGFAELLRRTRDGALEVYDHQELPFEKLVAELGLERDVSRPPLVQALFALQSYRDGGEGFEPDTTTTRFDLELYATERGDRLGGRFVYNSELFLPETIERLARRFAALLRAVVAAPDVPVSRLELLPDDERAQLARWNATEREHPGGTLHELIFAQAERTPDATAVVFDGDRLTYRELTSRARQVAAGLGDRLDQPVGVSMERSLDLPVVLLGVLAAGGAYLPLDPADPEERRRGMLEDAGAELVLTEAKPGGDFTARPVHEDNLAYVIFTSGSTGRPKGVGVSHRAIVNRLRWMQDTFRLTPEDRVLHKTPTTFDVSVWELFWPLITGATLVIARPDGHRDTAYLRDLIKTEQITTVHFVPSMLQAFLEEEHIQPPKRIICSGEALPPGINLPGLHNLYGPTEAAVDVSWHPCQLGEPNVSIGKPVDNTTLHVLDQHLQPVPIGTPGELYIGGVQLARGYLGKPALTAERFLPFSNGQRLYKTGDLARWLPTGELEYLGRTDHQVKIRGMRVELGEIETVLRRQPGVTAGAVRLVAGRLVGYVVGDVPVLSDVLPDFMIPTAWVRLDRLPVTSSGKLDRAALPAPERPADLPWEPPRGAAERAVAQVWQEVLELDRVGRNDTFFAVGGDSISSLKVVARLRATGYDVELQHLFTHQAVAELATVLRPRQAVAEPAAGAFDLLSPADRERLTR
ncbi:amino acid adenylation domain-containing protein [Nonomuraea sp. NN258]|uniref:non-ribosomal peptide synthetase n=1 Tax=Nonomuraea antri TaxID=2730852 RepID=UPI00156A5EE1|nr:non-ribosomal peptide synthetase [Nonomuraea antri]NRQ35524.1 amino acid adenylation domain-containing protein [Nonomuraea antri]